ncbi:MAG: LysR substrate-binding domain-containing protein, partial [Pseudomonadota bacterium]
GSSLSTLVQMVGAGIGVTLIPEMAVPIETRSAAVAVARLPRPRPMRTIGMVWRRTSPLSDHLAHVAETFRQAGTGEGRAGPKGARASRALRAPEGL